MSSGARCLRGDQSIGARCPRGEVSKLQGGDMSTGAKCLVTLRSDGMRHAKSSCCAPTTKSSALVSGVSHKALRVLSVAFIRRRKQLEQLVCFVI